MPPYQPASYISGLDHCGGGEDINPNVLAPLSTGMEWEQEVFEFWLDTNEVPYSRCS